MLGVEVILDAKLLGRVVVVTCAIPFEEGWKLLGVRLLDGELDGIVDFFASADTFEWLRSVWVNEAIKELAQGLVIV